MIDLNENTTIIFYFVCGFFILVGIVLIIYGKFSNESFSNTYYDENEESNIVGLKDTNKKKEKKRNNKIKYLEIDSDFNSDSIFKILPSFSPNKILNDNFNKLKEEIMKDSNIKKIKLVNSQITSFEEIPSGYLLKAQYITIENYLEDNDKYDKKRQCKYEVILNNVKNDVTVATCPICGGKIKDPTLLRCKFCDSILSFPNNNNNDEWNFEKYEKIDQL